LEESNADLSKKLEQVNSEYEEAKETITIHEDFFNSYGGTTDLEAFADIVHNWKGKAKAYDQQGPAMKQMKDDMTSLKSQLEAEKKKVAQAEARAGKTGSAVVAAGGSAASGELKDRYDRAVRDLEAARTKVAALEKQLREKDSEVTDLRSRLTTALAGAGSAGGEDDPLVEMVEHLLKDMEQMAKESEEYLAQVEKEFPSLTSPSAEPSSPPIAAKQHSSSQQTALPTVGKPAQQASAPSGQSTSSQASTKPAGSSASTTQQQQQAAKAPTVPQAPSSQQQQRPAWKK